MISGDMTLGQDIPRTGKNDWAQVLIEVLFLPLIYGKAPGKLAGSSALQFPHF